MSGERLTAADVTVVVWEAGGHACVRWQGCTAETFAALCAAVKRTFAHPADRSYDLEERCWRVPSRLRPRLAGWLARTFECDAIIGVEGEGRDRRTARAVTRDVDAAYTVLHLRPGAPLWACEAVYRAAQRVHHPDAGGTHDAAVAINRAIQAIREHGPPRGGRR